MGVWTEDFNKEATKMAMHNQLEVKKFAFNCYTTVSIAFNCYITFVSRLNFWKFINYVKQMKLIVDPANFDPNRCMREFKKLNKKYSILNDDLVGFSKPFRHNSLDSVVALISTSDIFQWFHVAILPNCGC